MNALRNILKHTSFAAVVVAFAAAAQEIAVAPGGGEAEERLEQSPRHGEFVKLDLPGTDVKLDTWVVYPERSDKAPAVIVVHEIMGLTDWVRAVADHLASQGFIALAPDMISGKENTGNVTAVVRALEDEEIVERLDIVFDYAKSIPSCTGKVGITGFCWGGAVSFLYAAHQPELAASVPYYGTAPDAEDLAQVEAPILAHYAEDDARVNVTLEPAEVALKEHGKSFEHHTYDGAGHGFLRAQEGRDGANRGAAAKAWPRTVEFLREHLESKDN